MMRSTTGQRVITWLAGLGGLGVILLLTSALLLPRVLDSQAVKERIRTFLSSRTTGNVVFENLDLHWFPRLAVVARGGRTQAAGGKGRLNFLYSHRFPHL